MIYDLSIEIQKKIYIPFVTSTIQVLYPLSFILFYFKDFADRQFNWPDPV